jgi:hypothetical protein
MIDNDQKYIEQQNWHRLNEKLMFDYNKLVFYYHEYEADQVLSHHTKAAMDRNW